jgi:hypothetical protein
MRYICYLSKERIDSLFESAFDGVVDGVISRSSREASGNVDFGVSHILAWIKAGLTFGGKLSSSSETTRRQTAISRLKAVLEYISTQEDSTSLRQAIQQGKFSADWYEINTRLRVPIWDPQSAIVDLQGNVDGYELNLSCAKENFSGLYREGDRLIPTSTNRFLFEGKISLPMSGLARIVSAEPEQRVIYGSPLYLVLNPLNEDLGEFDDVEI